LITSVTLVILLCVFQNAVDISGKTQRRMTSVTEVIKLDPDTNQLIFMEPYNWISKTDDRFENSHSSKVINNIKSQNDWTEEQLQEELENRKLVLKWMSQKNIRDYKEVGKIVYKYQKNPENLLKRVREELEN
jgi:flagellar protein FlaI